MLTSTHFIQCLSSNVKALRNGEVFLFGKQFFLRAESLGIVKVIKTQVLVELLLEKREKEGKFIRGIN